MVSATSPSASAQFLLTSKTIHAENSNLRSRSRSPTRNSRLARSSTEVRLQVSNALSAAFIAGSTCSFPAFWWSPTTCEGFAGFKDLILSVVLTRFPPTIKSYSRPSWARTFSIAARILRAFSGLLKSTSGSFANDPSCRRTCGRVGASTVAIDAPRGDIWNCGKRRSNN